MFRKLKNTIITIKEAVGLELQIGPDDHWQLSGVHVKFINEKLKKVDAYVGTDNLKELEAKLPKQVPLVLVINGKGILMRKTAQAENNLVNQLFPGSNPGDFFSVTCPDEEAGQYHFICRKTLIELVLERLEAYGLRPLSLDIGVQSLLQVLPFLETPDGVVNTSSYSVSLEQKAIKGIEYRVREVADNSTLMIGGEVYKTTFINALGAVLRVLLKPADQLNGKITTKAVLATGLDYKYYKLFHFTKWAVLTVLLLLLLGNFFVFNYYFGKNKALVQHTDLVRAATQRSLLEQTRSDSSYAFFINSGWNKNTRHGYYADRIAALAPETVRFSLLQTAPVQESVGVGDLVFSNNNIVLQGISTDPTELETFSRAIKNIPGVESAIINNYLYKRDLLAAVFTLEITIRL